MEHCTVDAWVYVPLSDGTHGWITVTAIVPVGSSWFEIQAAVLATAEGVLQRGTNPDRTEDTEVADFAWEAFAVYCP